MKIAGYDYLTEQNNRIRNQLQDFSTNPKAAEAVVPASSTDAPSSDSSQKAQEDGNGTGVTLSLSSSAGAITRAASRISNVASPFAPTEFSTKSSEETGSADTDTTPTDDTSAAGNAVLNQYRFFVQTTQYEDTDGAVRRIFR